MRPILLALILFSLTGCAALREQNSSPGQSAKATTEPAANPGEEASPAGTLSNGESLPSVPADESARPAGGRAAAAFKCGLEGARGAIESARFLSVLAIPLMPVMAAWGVALGASKGSCH